MKPAKVDIVRDDQSSESDLWVFAYGSLMWRPDFPFVEKIPAIFYGGHRSLCLYSHMHRGTPECPGLVLGLDEGGECAGVAYRVSADKHAGVIEYLREREQSSQVYIEHYGKVHVQDGREVVALVFLVNRAHPQYTGVLSREKQLEIVRRSVGKSGRNPDYVINTHHALHELGIEDEVLAWLTARLQEASEAEEPAHAAL